MAGDRRPAHAVRAIVVGQGRIEGRADGVLGRLGEVRDRGGELRSRVVGAGPVAVMEVQRRVGAIVEDVEIGRRDRGLTDILYQDE